MDDKPENVSRSPAPSIAHVMGAIAMYLERAPTGVAAELRRMSPSEPGSPAMYRIAAEFLEPVGYLSGTGASLEREERRWTTILSCVARMVGLHQPGRRLGVALADADVAEVRFLRLIRSHGQALEDELRSIVHILSTRGSRFDLADLARLVLSDGSETEESVRRTIARDFYHQSHASRPENA